ncbi:MAG: hypothetical protein V4722_26690 [Bacteroidota bacterium]
MSKLKSTLFFLFNLLLSHSQTISLPGPVGSGKFGGTVTVLTNGNYVISDTLYDEGTVIDVGAIYLYNGSSHNLISVLSGSHLNDRIGSGGITVLNNGNFVVNSLFWDNDIIIDAGAVTWCNGTTGLTGVVSAGNSLVGTNDYDLVGNYGTSALNNGNYVVVSINWDHLTKQNVGAVTWGDGSFGISGEINSNNSLIGSTANDMVGRGYPEYKGITALSNGNYVVASAFWDNEKVIDGGAASWCDGVSGRVGFINGNNSLVGGSKFDLVSGYGIHALPNGNYVVISSSWSFENAIDAGAVTWANGTTGIAGEVGSANSLVGSTSTDLVGLTGITILNNSNFVFTNSIWDNGPITNAGAVTWVNGATGLTGVISSSNSLVGSTVNDFIGSSVTALTNGNYVVGSIRWHNGVIADAGAATWANGTTGITGSINSNNSLVGTNSGDYVGRYEITPLSNGNYVVSSEFWDNGSIQNAGAATWGNGLTGITGEVNHTNSLVGTTVNDFVGESGVIALKNGNYVVASFEWDNGAITNAGAATWGSGTTGIAGEISANNSLVGSKTNDYIGRSVTALTNGNYVVSSPSWDNGTTVDAGASTWASGITGITGFVITGNSLVGSLTGDRVGGSATALSNGKYVVGSMYWSNGSVANVGAITWADGSAAVTGNVGSHNSLVGNSPGDRIGYNGVYALNSGDNFMVISALYDNGPLTDAMAISWGNSSYSTTGNVNSCNSIMGSTANAWMYWYFMHNPVYNYLIVGQSGINAVAVYNPAGMPLSVDLDSTAIDITGTSSVPLMGSLGCRVIAVIKPVGTAPVNGMLKAKTIIEVGSPAFNNQPYINRHYEINATSTAMTGRVTLFFTEAEFDSYNLRADAIAKLPGTNGQNKQHLRIAQYTGTSVSSLPGTYTGDFTLIDPDDSDIIWDATLQRWQVSFESTGFGGFFVTAIATYRFIGTGTWTDARKWLNNVVPPAVLPSYCEISIANGSNCILNVPQSISKNAKITVETDANLHVNGNLSIN